MRLLAAAVAAALLIVGQSVLAQTPGPAATTPAAATAQSGGINITGRVGHPGLIGLDAVRKLPAQTLSITINSEHGSSSARFTGPLLWSVLQLAGGLDDPAKTGPLHHTLKVTGNDGYFVVLSTGELAPDFGGKEAILAYQRDDKPLGGTGFRLIIPGDKLGGRDVRDISTIAVE